MQKRKIDKIIQKIVKRILLGVNPDKIFLFGSYATGSFTKDSDLDILIVAKSRLRREQLRQRIERLLSDRDVPLDFVLYTPEQFKLFSKVEGSFVGNVVKEGKVLYEKAS